MSTKAGPDKRDYSSAGSVQEAEHAPSAMRGDEAQFPRLIGLIGLVAFLIGLDWVAWSLDYWSLTRQLLKLFTKDPVIDTFKTLVGSGFFVGGLGGMLFHAVCEKDLQLRRAYGFFGLFWLVIGLVVMLLPLISLITGGLKFAEHWFLPGFLAECLGLVFLLAFVRNETDVDWKRLAILILGGLGAAAAVVGFLVGLIRPDFLAPTGLLLTGLGLAFLWSFIFAWGDRDDIAELVAKGTALGGALFFLAALIRSLIPLIPALKWSQYFIPSGLLIMAMAAAYVGLYVFLRVEWRFLAMVRRELSSFFYSPVAYLVLLGFTVVGWASFVFFLFNVSQTQQDGSAIFEPIVQSFFVAWFPIIAMMFIVPAVTMRSLSEEQRTGTMEVLLTAPVSETSVVLSKFVGTLIFYMMLWVPWCLFLIAVRIAAGHDFDFRPLLSFLVAAVCSGAGFVAMGLFFSGFTRNQVIAAVLTFAGMFGLFAVFLAMRFLGPANPLQPVFQHVSFVELWINSLDGKLQPNFLIFHISAAVFWLFLTAKILEARKWS